MAFHYVARSQKPTAVTSAVTAAFTGPDDLNLIVAKTTALEILRVTPDGLEAVLDVDLNAEITTVDVYHPHAGGSDWLLLATARAQFSVLAFDPATGTLQTKAQGNLRDNVGKPASNGGKAAVAPSRDLVGLYYSENLFKVIPIGMPDRFREAFNVRLDEGRVVDFCFLHNQPSPTVCILFQDARQAARVKTYTILPAQRDLAAGPWQFDAPASAHRLHPVEHGSGVLVFSSDSILHYDGEETCRAQTPGSHVFSSARVDKNRVLFSQQDGTLAVVVLSAEGGKVRSARRRTRTGTAAAFASPPHALSPSPGLGHQRGAAGRDQHRLLPRVPGLGPRLRGLPRRRLAPGAAGARARPGDGLVPHGAGDLPQPGPHRGHDGRGHGRADAAAHLQRRRPRRLHPHRPQRHRHRGAGLHRAPGHQGHVVHAQSVRGRPPHLPRSGQSPRCAARPLRVSRLTPLSPSHCATDLHRRDARAQHCGR